MNKRLEWIDVCKGILIITIVLMHINFSFWSENAAGKYIGNLTSLYKVSIFFCVAGLTLKDEKIRDTRNFIKGKIKNLYFKIIAVGVITVLLHNVLINIGFYQIGLGYAGKVMKSYELADYIKQIILTLFMANREVIIGPMWYANVLFIALIILALLDRFIHLFVKNDNARTVRLIATLCLMLTSSALTNVAGFTIPRFNNSLTAVFLIDLCQFLYRKLEWKFDNPWDFIISAIVLFSLPLYGYLSMNKNVFQDPAFLLVVAICGMYVLYYLSQKIVGGVLQNTLIYWKSKLLDYGNAFYWFQNWFCNLELVYKY